MEWWDAQREEKRKMCEELEAEEEAFVAYERRMNDIFSMKEKAEIEAKGRARKALCEEWKQQKKKPADVETEEALLIVEEQEEGQQYGRLLREQIEEKRERREKERESEEFEKSRENYFALGRSALDFHESEKRKEILKSIVAANLAQARENEEKRKFEKNQIAKIEQLQVQHQKHQLKETTATSLLSSTRYRPDHFKGFSQEENHVILKENQRLIEIKRNKQKLLQEEQREYDEAVLLRAKVAQTAEETVLLEKRRLLQLLYTKPST